MTMDEKEVEESNWSREGTKRRRVLFFGCMERYW